VKTLRIDHVTVVSPDAARAAATFERLFGFAKAAPAESADAGSTAAVTIGDARIEFRTPVAASPLGEALQTGGEGMVALTLMVADLDQAGATLQRAGIRFDATIVGDRRTLVIDPRAAHGVRLALMAHG
jgi:catechol 2,3-dioxygenase-like lactoylglutathione lyase family enzyme